MNNGSHGNKLPDTPWHIGFPKKDAEDPRRHRARCVHINNGICTYWKCRCFNEKCTGSAHCKYYAESQTHWDEVYLNTRTAEEEYSDDFLKAAMKLNERNKKKASGVFVNNQKSKSGNVCPFTGIESIRLKQIKTPESYQTWKHSREEYLSLVEYHAKYRKLDKPIVVEIRDSHYYLKENFLQYRVAKKLNKTWIRATMNLGLPKRP